MNFKLGLASNENLGHVWARFRGHSSICRWLCDVTITSQSYILYPKSRVFAVTYNEAWWFMNFRSLIPYTPKYIPYISDQYSVMWRGNDVTKLHRYPIWRTQSIISLLMSLWRLLKWDWHQTCTHPLLAIQVGVVKVSLFYIKALRRYCVRSKEV